MATNKKVDGDLTHAQIMFAVEVANGSSLSKAYTAAFGESTKNPETLQKEASALAKRPHVAEKIRDISRGLERSAAAKAAYTLEVAIREADEIRLAAVAAGNHGAATSAATLKAKLAGLLVERKEVRSGDLDALDTAEILAIREELKKAREDREAHQDLIGAPAAPAAHQTPSQDNRPTARVLQ